MWSYKKYLGPFLLVALLNACVEHPRHHAEGTQAQLRSWMEILSVNGDTPDDRYNLTLIPGTYHLEVAYKTYRQDYLCHFEFEAVGGRSYEIVDHSNPEPLILYRWQRANGAWSERLDPVLPHCEERSR
ncbi:hypothetical protein EY643_11535 [Halioglobus maricola]|uniref:Uncharacterized protein n=1 Tax=Halioglobus maricola TaxID=2601894 RepID=A0A5P9NK65_9GAMM|nr:hypothetical protein [Halioglobus maricola]QFU76241.1 hypothetical protein EY643_11535 [Halioglobus maricola]